jgi:glycosyltransferase involved in cell wall biosynthesis
MAHVVMADDGIAFDGATAASAPLGGAETAFAALAEALAGRGHRVEVRNRCRRALAWRGVDWAPIGPDMPRVCDLHIGNRGTGTIGLVRDVRRRLLWLHNPAGYLKKPRNLWRLARWRPVLVVTGTYHAATISSWLPSGGRETIPYGMLETFRHAALRPPPPPRAIFTSSPLRGLDWLLDRWTQEIAPAVPGAELHIYAGAAVYGAEGSPMAARMEALLARADGLAGLGVRRFAPVAHDQLAAALSEARVMLYRGDPGETFCLALAEAQAMGVPAIVTREGAVCERVIDGVTGRIAEADSTFAAAAIAALGDDALWRRWHRAALDRQRGLSWDDVAACFETLL